LLTVIKMANKKQLKQKIEIPAGITLAIDGNIVFVKGPKGENKRKLINPLIIARQEDNKLILEAKKNTKKEKKIMMSLKAHVKNMIRGAKEGYVYKLKVCSGHFPMTAQVDGKRLLIKNFLGEKIPRKAKILDSVEVKVEGDVITVTSIDREKAGQTAANIEQSTRITNRDRRVFQDGCYITSKPERI